MSTRSVIARPEGDGFIGRYAHWDGYPTCRGAQLWQSFKELGSAEALRKYAIREGEKGYWSSYQPPSEAARQEALPEKVTCKFCDGTGTRPTDDCWDADSEWAKQCGGCNACGGTGMERNRERHDGWTPEEHDNMVSSLGDDMGTEWAYVIADMVLSVFERRFGDPDNDDGHGTGMFGYGASDTEDGGYWKLVCVAPWDGPEPDWEAVQEQD